MIQISLSSVKPRISHQSREVIKRICYTARGMYQGGYNDARLGHFACAKYVAEFGATHSHHMLVLLGMDELHRGHAHHSIIVDSNEVLLDIHHGTLEDDKYVSGRFDDAEYHEIVRIPIGIVFELAEDLTTLNDNLSKIERKLDEG